MAELANGPINVLSPCRQRCRLAEAKSSAVEIRGMKIHQAGIAGPAA
jgi:hypothetical protein